MIATRSPPYGYRHTITTTRPQLPSAGLRAGLCAAPCDELCARLYVGTFDYRNLLRAFGLKALSAAFNPLAPTATPSFWPAATFFSWPISFVKYGRWRPLSLSGPWPSPAFNLRRPLAYRALLATVGY